MTEYLPWIYGLALSLWGGVVHYAKKVREGEAWSWLNFFLDIILCLFTGSITFFVCKWQGIEGWEMAITITLGAYAGPQGLVYWNKLREKLLRDPNG